MLIDIVKQSAQKFPHRPALTMQMGFRTITLTYGQVYEMAKKTALFLQSKGLKKGDALLLLAPNSPYWIVIYWAAILGGFVIVPLNTQSMPDFVQRIAEQTGTQILFKYLYFRHDIPGIEEYDVEYLPELVASFDPKNFVGPELRDDEVFQILYTSGTTGDPKGVMLTHTNVYSNVIALSQVLEIHGARERLLSVLPLSHILEQVGGFLLPYYYGAHIIFAHSPAAIGRLMRKYRITKMITVPEFLHIMMGRIEDEAAQQGKLDLLKKLMNFSMKLHNKWFARTILFPKVIRAFGGQLDTLATGGAPLDPELEKKWNALGIYVLQGYGLTETSPTISYNDFKHHRFGSVGRLLEGVTVKLGPDNEIWVKGPNVFTGYFKNPQKTKEAFSEDGWFKTTDIGEFDSDGYLYLRGRKKYMILGPGGQNVFPEDIEWELNKVDGVKDCTVIGLERTSGHVEIHAVLLLEDGYSEKDGKNLVDQANKNLSSYQRVTGFSIWPEVDFPRSSTRKVKKDEVKKYIYETKEHKHHTAKMTTTPLRRLLGHITDIEPSKITDTTTMEQLQMDSLMRIEILARIEQEYRVVLDESKLLPSTTVTQLETMMKEAPAIRPYEALKRWPRTWWARGLRAVTQTIGFLLTRIFVRLEVQGLDNIRGLATPAIFMPNHLSYLDGVVLAMALPYRFRRKLSFAAARDVLYEHFKRIAWIGELLFNTFPLPRKEGENIKQGLEHMGELMDMGYSVVLFPEGHMSEDGKLLPFKKGSGLVSVEMDSYVVPVKLVGTNDILPYAKIVPRKRGTVVVKFGKPLKFTHQDTYEEAMQKIRKAMELL
ncbi:MAG: AMP-binding protein [Candidatus Babeliales bacterium]